MSKNNVNTCCMVSKVTNVSKRGVEGELRPLSTKAFCGFIYNMLP